MPLRYRAAAMSAAVAGHVSVDDLEGQAVLAFLGLQMFGWTVAAVATPTSRLVAS